MIHHGDLFDVLPTLQAESFHACVTDPPYGIGFMGREWDTFKPARREAEARRKLRKEFRMDHSGPRYDAYQQNPNTRNRKRSPAMSPSQIEYDRSLHGEQGFQAWTERWGREVFRVLKPGAHLIVCGAPRSYHRMACGIEDAGFEVRDCLCWLFGQGFPKSKNLGHGWGTALKPSYEPIVLARKPFTGSTQSCHDAHGTAGLNIGQSRLEPSDDFKYNQPVRIARWPANALLDEEAASLLDEQSGELSTGEWPSHRNGDKFSNIYGGFKGTQADLPQRSANTGGASRFFYVAKPSREERDLGCESLPARPRDESRQVGHPGGDNPRNRGLQPRGNFHPTVKPLALMRWLVRLVMPRGGRVLDPFAGSGTTGMACAAEGVDFMLIERETEYIPIIEARVQAIAPLFTDLSVVRRVVLAGDS